METGYANLTVRFEAPFWVLLYEREAEEERKFALRQEKRRGKRKGH